MDETRATGKEREQTGEKPSPPFPEQHQEKPGIEAQLKPRPQYEAPLYRGSGKL